MTKVSTETKLSSFQVKVFEGGKEPLSSGQMTQNVRNNSATSY